MKYAKRNRHLSQYVYSNCNQHGCTYKKAGDKLITVATLTADVDNYEDLARLILLSNSLDVPVRYDFTSSPQKAYICIVGNEAISGGPQ